MCAGKMDFVTVKNSDGTKESHQNKLILYNIWEAYSQYKSIVPDDKIWFSKFAKLQSIWSMV